MFKGINKFRVTNVFGLRREMDTGRSGALLLTPPANGSSACLSRVEHVPIEHVKGSMMLVFLHVASCASCLALLTTPNELFRPKAVAANRNIQVPLPTLDGSSCLSSLCLCHGTGDNAAWEACCAAPGAKTKSTGNLIAHAAQMSSPYKGFVRCFLRLRFNLVPSPMAPSGQGSKQENHQFGVSI